LFSFSSGDCDPVGDIQRSFHYTSTIEQAAAISVSSGNDINCGPEFKLLHQALVHGFVNLETINLAISRALRSRFLSGNFDPIGTDPYSSIPYSTVDSLEHKLLTKQVVSESMVLLQNPNKILPFDITKMKQIAVIGPSSDDISVQAHTYHGTPSKWITTLDGIQSIALQYNVTIVHTAGASRKSSSQDDFAHAIALSNASDIILFVGGLDETFEEEDTDRNSLRLSGGQFELIQLLMELNKPFAILIISGSPIAEPSLVSANQVALLWISYFGQSGDAIADLLFGLSVPSGCLPFTIAVDTTQMLPIDDYSMNKSPGRTYRYLDYQKAPPLFPFGYGLSYSNFIFDSKLIISPNQINNLDTNITVNINVTNEGPFHASLVIQLYYEFINSTVIELPVRELLQFTKIQFEINEQKTISFTFRIRDIPNSNRQQIPGVVNFWIGNSRDRYAQATLVIHFDS
jgi:beta-glucosidase